MFLSGFFTSAGMDTLPDAYLYGWQHFVYIGFAVISMALILRYFKPKDPRITKRFINVALVLMLLLKYGGEVIFVSEWYRYAEPVSSFSHPFWDWRTLISFQICGVNNIFLPLVIWFNWKPLKNFVYVSSIIGGIAVILYPVGVLYGDPFVLTFPMLRSLIVHYFLVLIPLYQIKTGELKFENRHWPRYLWGSIAVNLWALYGNLFVDPNANNLYMMSNPFYGGPVPLLNVLQDGWHLPFQYTLVAVSFYVIHRLIMRYQRRHPVFA